MIQGLIRHDFGAPPSLQIVLFLDLRAPRDTQSMFTAHGTEKAGPSKVQGSTVHTWFSSQSLPSSGVPASLSASR